MVPVRRPLAVAVLPCLAAWLVVVGGGAHIFHYDARAHLVVARRVFDSLTPGWIQLGAVWLPLPQILNALPAQVDVLYRTGASASLISLAAFVLGLWALAEAARSLTGDPRAAWVAMAVPALNPGWLYLQATPLSEPLFFAAASGVALFVIRARRLGRRRDFVLATACCAVGSWIRYEAWPLAAAATVVACWPSSRAEVGRALRRAAAMGGAGFVLPVLLFGLHSWIATERLFYVMDARFLVESRGGLAGALASVFGGAVEAFGAPLLALAAAAMVRLARRPALGLAVCLALASPAVVTLAAYLAGHPTKPRYPLLLAPAIALAVAAASRARPATQAAVLAVAAAQLVAVPDPLPVFAEATRYRPWELAMRPDLELLRREYRGGRILTSMGSAAPMLFDLGLPLREIVHEGNGTYWEYAAVDPASYVAWVIVARGDVLEDAQTYRRRFPEGFVRVRRFEKFTLYRRAFPVAGPALAGK